MAWKYLPHGGALVTACVIPLVAGPFVDKVPSMGEVASASIVMILVLLAWACFEIIALRRSSILRSPQITADGRGCPALGSSLHEVESAITRITHAGIQVTEPEPSVATKPNHKSRGGMSVLDGAIPATAAAAIAGVDWWRSDPDVMTAVEHLTHQDINNGLDLWQTFADRDYALGNEHFLTMLRGHVGEASLFREMTEAGVDFSVPEASNFPGLDMSVGDVDLNVKIGQSTSTIAEHLRTHPDIPVVVNSDMEGIPPDALHALPEQLADPSILEGHSIIVMDGLTLSGIQEQISDALGTDAFADGPLDLDPSDLTDGLEIPVLSTVIRVATVGRREYNNAKVHGDRRRAALNTAVDATASGVGVGVGAQTGAEIGAMIDVATGGLTLGLGTLFGTIIGAATGGLAGRRVGTYVKDGPLREASNEAAKAVRQYGEASQSALAKANEDWSSQVAATQAELDRTAERLSQKVREVIRQAHAEQKDLEMGFSTYQRDRLTQVVGEVRHRRTWGLLAWRRKMRWLQTVGQAADSAAECISLRSQVRGQMEGIQGDLEDLSHRRAALQALTVLKAQETRHVALTARAAAVTSLRPHESRLKTQVQTTCRGPARNLWRANQQVRTELVKTGHLSQQQVDDLFPAQAQPS